jgi:hypothetical protein
MKNTSLQLASIAIALSLGALNASAQSPAPVIHASRSAVYSGAASGEASAAAAASAESTARAATGVIAVPLWASGAIVQGSGTVVKAAGAASVEIGQATAQGANEIWDFAAGDSTARPPLNRSLGVPAPKPAAPKDPTPAEALRRKM